VRLRNRSLVASAPRADIAALGVTLRLWVEGLQAYHGHTAGIYGHVTRDNGGNWWSLLVTGKPLQSLGSGPKSLERATRIELAFSAWEADVLPLNYARGETNDNARRMIRTLVSITREGYQRRVEAAVTDGTFWR